jgi:hypothetical protein
MSDGLKAAVLKFHKKECPERQHFFATRRDPKWKEYLNFLYPNSGTIEHYRSELEELGALGWWAVDPHDFSCPSEYGRVSGKIRFDIFSG